MAESTADMQNCNITANRNIMNPYCSGGDYAMHLLTYVSGGPEMLLQNRDSEDAEYNSRELALGSTAGKPDNP